MTALSSSTDTGLSTQALAPIFPATAKIPVILCSGKLQVTDFAWAEKMGAKACVLKPVSVDELKAVIGKLG